MTEHIDFKTALGRAMNLCSKREFCSSDIKEKLQAWGLGATEITKALDKLKEEKFIDNARYAKAFARDKFRYNKWGRIKIAAHLRYRKIEDPIINEALQSIDNEEYLSLIKKIMELQRKKTKAKNPLDLKGKLLRFGLSKGFESELLYGIINDKP
jgi:regulatory protein